MDNFLRRTQAVSGIMFGTFSTLHLGGHFLSNFSFRLADSALFATREVFRNPWVEYTFIGASLTLHIISSFVLAARRKTFKLQFAGSSVLDLKRREISLHRVTGYILSFLILIHITATRLLPLMYMEDPDIIDLSMVTHSMIGKYGIMHAYYITLGAAGLYHSFYGANEAFGFLGLPKLKFKPGWWISFGYTMILFSISTVLALSGCYEEINIPLHQEYSRLETSTFLSFLH